MNVGKNKQLKGFTIVELLIVIVVIAILAAVTIVSYNGISQRAKAQQANSDLNTFAKAIYAARLNTGKTLLQVTGSGCSTCQNRINTSIDLISAASGVNIAHLKAGDPWGNPYRLDENEGENGNCTNDSIGLTVAQSNVTIPTIERFAC